MAAPNATTEPAPIPEKARVILTRGVWLDWPCIIERWAILIPYEELGKLKDRRRGTHMIPFQVAQLAATILDTAERRFPHKYTGLLPYTLAKGTMRRGPNPEKIIYSVLVPLHRSKRSTVMDPMASGIENAECSHIQQVRKTPGLG